MILCFSPIFYFYQVVDNVNKNTYLISILAIIITTTSDYSITNGDHPSVLDQSTALPISKEQINNNNTEANISSTNSKKQQK